MFPLKTALWSAAVFALVGSAAANATLVTIDFSGTLGTDFTHVTSLGVFSAGDHVTGSFTYDTGAATIFNFGNQADYAMVGGSITDGATTLSLPGNVGHQDDFYIQHVGVDAFEPEAYTSDFNGSGQGYDVTIYGSAPFGSVFSGVSLPSSLDLASFTMQGSIIGNPGSSSLSINLIAGPAPGPIPEPATLSLMGLALTALGAFRRRRA